MNKLFTEIFAHPIEEVTPKVVDLAHPIKIAGMSMETNKQRIYRDVPRLAKQYEEYKKAHVITNKKDPWAFAAVSLDFDEPTGAFTYVLGDVVNTFENLPPGLIKFKIPAMKYAVFPIRPKNRFGWGIAIGSAKRYIYGTWLPNSEYEQGRVIDDFEYHDERSTRSKSPEIDLYVCIRQKKG